jgi:hypothetical protein
MLDSEQLEKSLIKIHPIHIRAEMSFLAERYKVKNFIETGTHIGQTVLFMASKKIFANIHSIEISEMQMSIMKEYFSKFAEDNNIDISNTFVWHGDSVKVLPRILTDISERSLFWLDAHCSGGYTANSKDYNCTILQELDIIKSHNIKDNVIVIDDMSTCNDGLSDYPSIGEISESILSINKDYLITIKYNALFAEVPSSARMPYKTN